MDSNENHFIGGKKRIIIDVCLDNERPSKVYALFSGRPLDGLGSIAVQRSLT
jgi:hypothetical protein